MNLFYRTHGSGTPVIILHGLYGASDNWMQILRKMPSGYQYIAIDQRNHGLSPHDSSHTYDDMVTDLAWLMHELEIEKAHIMGHSMGGKAAIAFAADYPEKTLSLTIADISPKNYLKNKTSDVQYSFHKKILKAINEFPLSKYTSRKGVDSAFSVAIPEKHIRQFVLKNIQRKDQTFEWKLNAPVLQDYLDQIIGGVDYRNYEDRTPITSYPTLFIKGELSNYIQESDKKIIKSMYPEARIATIAGATHFLHAEKPLEFIEIWSQFLKSTSSLS